MPEDVLAEKYRITELLGEGGIGVVYKAIELSTGKDVAIKFLIEEQTDSPEEQQIRERYFEREIVLLNKIRHPSIVSLLDTGFTRLGLPYFVMEYIDGQTLAQVILKEGALIVGRTFNLLQQLCSALDCIHQQGAIHRDLKPENLMITRREGKEEIKLLDFGISKMLDSTEQSPLMQITQVGHIVGTVDYLAPEQWEDKELDQRTDIYALGLITFEMLTGQHPFRSDSFAQMMAMHLHEDPPPPSSLNQNVPIMLDHVILRSLSKEKANRQSTAIEFLADFEGVLADIYRRSLSYLSNPSTETLSFDANADEEN